MKSILRSLYEALLPAKTKFLIRYLRNKYNNKLDLEMYLVQKLLKKKRRFIDIGANVGFYSYYYSSIFQNIEAFEPIAHITQHLSQAKFKNITIYNEALSNLAGKMPYNIPIVNGEQLVSRASLENMDAECETKEVQVKRLDDFDFGDIDLIKIDVEGHEEKVILGASVSIKKHKPILIVEIEQRHIQKDINLIFELIINLGYSGFYLDKQKLKPLDKFSYKVHQEPYLNDVLNKNYINNFVFQPLT